jgi:hypothetical protein
MMTTRKLVVREIHRYHWTKAFKFIFSGAQGKENALRPRIIILDIIDKDNRGRFLDEGLSVASQSLDPLDPLDK